VWPIVSHDGAAMLIYRPRKEGDAPRGWYIRSYHSVPAMDAHLNHILYGASPPKHWNKPEGWDFGLHPVWMTPA
jgi:hypothetical protein